MDYSNPSCCLTSKASRTLPYKIPNARKQLNCSINTQRFRIVGDDNVSDGVKHELNVGRVHATRFITIDFFIRRFVLSFKLGLNVGRRFFVLLCPCDEFVWVKTFLYNLLKIERFVTCVLWEADCQRRFYYFLFKDIFFV